MLSSVSRRFFATAGKKQIAVLLSGCGVYDGSEIHEAVFVMESISRCGGAYQCIAPNMDQKHVINHLTGDPMDEKRNIMIESARIARSNVLDMDSIDISKYDALVLPGGFGVAKNLSNFGSEGPKMEVTDNVKKFITAFHDAKKPIAACCIAPIIAARLFPNVRVTLGQEKVCDENPYADACAAVKAMGAVHVPCDATEVCVDKEMKVVSSPAYMRNGPIHVIHDSIDNMIKALFEML